MKYSLGFKFDDHEIDLQSDTLTKTESGIV